MKKTIILIFLTLLFFVNSGTTEAKILSKNLVKKAVVEYATKNEFCLLKDPLVIEKILLQPSVIDADGNTPNFGSEISDKDCDPDNNQEIIFGYVRLDFLDSFNSPPEYEQIFLVGDKILRADSFAFDYYKNFNPSQQPHQDVFLGKAIGQKSIRSSSLLLTDPALPEGQKATENSGYILTFKSDGTRDKLFFLYEGKAYLSTKTLKEITDEITLVDYTASSNTSPTPTASNSADTANWKTYKGEDVMFKLPQEWTTEGGYPSQDDITIKTNVSSENLTIRKDLITDPYGKEVSLEEYLKVYSYDNNYQREEKNSGGISILYFKSKPTSSKSVRAIIVKNEYKYEFVYNFYTSENLTLFDQILSTFTFTSQENLISPTIGQRMVCKTDTDCAADEVCAAAGPVIQGAAQQMSCWKKNEPRPL